MSSIYCLKCRKETQTSDVSEEWCDFGKGPRHILKGKCKVCKSKKSKFLRSTQASPFDDDLYPELGAISVPRSAVQLLDELGQGFYGTTYRALMATGDVAAKVLKELGQNPEGVKKFLEEAARMKMFNHRNVISIIGVVKDPKYPIILMPLMGQGNLKNALSCKSFTPGDLVNLCHQASHGMKYLASLLYIHRDLAARNCLLDENYELKISDFGLAHKLNLLNAIKDDTQCYYRIQNRGMPLPIKWMALESIRTGIFTLQTDVWSYGVLMWEIYTKGQMPYSDVDNGGLLSYLQRGGRLQAPSQMPSELKTIMELCWDEEPSRWQTFHDIAATIQRFVGGNGRSLTRSLTASVPAY